MLNLINEYHTDDEKKELEQLSDTNFDHHGKIAALGKRAKLRYEKDVFDGKRDLIKDAKTVLDSMPDNYFRDYYNSTKDYLKKFINQMHEDIESGKSSKTKISMYEAAIRENNLFQFDEKNARQFIARRIYYILDALESGILKGENPNFFNESIKRQIFTLIDAKVERFLDAAADDPKNLPRINISQQVKEIAFPLDKVNRTIWQPLNDRDRDETGHFPLKAEKQGTKNKIDIYFDIDFSGLEELEKQGVISFGTKALTAFDKRVYDAVCSCFLTNGEYMTISEIYRAMGNTGAPASKQVKKIYESLTKMGALRFYLNNEQEIDAGMKYPKVVNPDAPLLPFKRAEKIIINNKVSKNVIMLYEEPTLLQFARGRDQITSIPIEVLQSPVSKTDTNLSIDTYLIYRISRMKNPSQKSSRKILYETIFDKCGITTKQQRYNAKEKIKNFLDHYKKTNFIKSYSKDKDGVYIKKW